MRVSNRLSPVTTLYTSSKTDLSENIFLGKKKCQHFLNRSEIQVESIEYFPPFMTVSADLLILRDTEKLGYVFNKVDV